MGSSQYPEWSGAPLLNFWQGDPVKNVPLWNYVRFPGNQRQFLVFSMETDPDGASTTPSAPLPTGVSLTGARTEYVTYPGSGGVNGITTGIQFRVTDSRNGYHKSSPLTQVKIAGAIVLTPSQPANFAVVAKSATEIEVSWTPGAGGSVVTAYHLFRAPAQSGPYVEISADADSPYSDTGLDSGTDYWYTVAAEDAAHAFSGSTVAKSATTFTGPPAIPVGVTAYAVDDDVIRVSWVAGSGGPAVDHFVLYHAASAGGSYTAVDPATSPYDHTGNDPQETVYFKVRAVDHSGVMSDYSAIVSAQTQTAPLPATPQGVTAAGISTSTNRMAWEAVAGATSYRAYVRGTQANPGALFYSGALLTADHTLTASPSSNLTRYYDVSAVNAAGEGQRSVTVSATTLAFDGPAAPANVQLSTPEQGTLRLSWQAGSGGTAVVSWKVYRSTTSGGAQTVIATPLVGVTSIDDTGLPDGVPRFYQVTAVDATPLESAKSVEATATTLPALTPQTPGNVQANAVSQTGINVTWTPTAGGATAVFFRIYRSSFAAGPFTAIKDASGTSYIDNTLSASQKRWYQVSAFDANDVESGRSTTAYATTWDVPPIEDTFHYYVSPNGNDSATGTSQANALKTIQAAVNKVQPGQTIGVMNGTYAITTDIKTARDGTSAAPIRMIAYTGHAPIVTGGTANRFVTMSHQYNYWGAGIKLRGNNTPSSSNSAATNTAIFNAAKPENGVVLAANNCKVEFDVEKIKLNWVLIDVALNRARLTGMDCYINGALDRGDGNDAGNGIQIHHKGAQNIVIEQCRLASGGHDCIQSYGGPVLLRESLLSSSWETLWATGKGTRLWTFRDNGLRTVIEDCVLHSSLTTVDNPQSHTMQKMANTNMLMKRTFQIVHRATSGSQVAILSPPPPEGDPTASDQRFAHVTLHDSTGSAIGAIDNDGANGFLAPFRFTNLIISANTGARAIDLSYQSTKTGVRSDWRQLYFFRKCGFEANYTVRIRDMDSVQATITKTITQCVTDYPNNFASNGEGGTDAAAACFVAAPNYVSAGIPASTDPLTALAQARAGMLPQAAAYLGTGVHLTRVNKAGGYTAATTVVLDDAKWFRDSMGVDGLAGDTIYLEGAGARVITQIAGNQVSLDSAVTVADNAKVWLGNSATPNVGAA